MTTLKNIIVVFTDGEKVTIDKAVSGFIKEGVLMIHLTGSKHYYFPLCNVKKFIFEDTSGEPGYGVKSNTWGN